MNLDLHLSPTIRYLALRVDVSPPWGPDVSKALDSIAQESSILTDDTTQRKTSFEQAEYAVSVIVSAFQRQNDVEQGARLGRKNMQVMDRLAKMQAHKRNSIAAIRDSYGRYVVSYSDSGVGCMTWLLTVHSFPLHHDSKQPSCNQCCRRVSITTPKEFQCWIAI